MLVPGSLRLDQLHLVFQEVMGWTNTHLHQFRIGDALYGMHFEDWPEEELHETHSNSPMPRPPTSSSAMTMTSAIPDRHPLAD
jgi:hypothetical protein